jgi:hypothetical protein
LGLVEHRTYPSIQRAGPFPNGLFDRCRSNLNAYRLLALRSSLHQASNIIRTSFGDAVLIGQMDFDASNSVVESLERRRDLRLVLLNRILIHRYVIVTVNNDLHVCSLERLTNGGLNYELTLTAVIGP